MINLTSNTELVIVFQVSTFGFNLEIVCCRLRQKVDSVIYALKGFNLGVPFKLLLKWRWYLRIFFELFLIWHPPKRFL